MATPATGSIASAPQTARWLRTPLVEAVPEDVKTLHFGSLVLAQEDDWPAWRAAVIKAETAAPSSHSTSTSVPH